jgi:hypothetical protein
MYFPPAFFDISVHFTTHLIKEIKLLGPMSLHQMYAYERFKVAMKIISHAWRRYKSKLVKIS